MPKPFQLQRFEALLRKRLGLQGLVGLTLLEDVQCVIPLWGPGLPEDLFLKQELRWGQQLAQGPVAGQFSWAEVGNPPGSGHLVVVEHIDESGTQAAHVGILPGFVSPGAATAQPLDARQFLDNPRPVASLQIGSAAVATVANWVATLRVAGTGFAAVQQVVLPPGTSCRAEGTTANTGVELIFVWREVRLATPQELEQHG